MKKSRFWFGVGLVVFPVLVGALLFAPTLRLTGRGPVEGFVSFHGRPLAGGSILFVPADPNHAQWAHAWIDESGHYRIGSGWDRGGSSNGKPFRICVIPNSHSMGTTAHGSQGDSTAQSFDAAWWGLGNVAFPTPPSGSGFPRRLSNPATTGLKVRIGSEPSRIDVTL
jgi:hypothetical protein